MTKSGFSKVVQQGVGNEGVFFDIICQISKTYFISIWKDGITNSGKLAIYSLNKSDLLIHQK